MEPIELIYSLSNGIMFHHLRIGWVFFWVRSPRAMLTKKKNLAGTYVYSRSYVFPLFFSRTRPLHRETFIGGIFIYIYTLYIYACTLINRVSNRSTVPLLSFARFCLSS